MKYNRQVVFDESIKEGPYKGDWVLERGDVSATYKNGSLPVTAKVLTRKTFGLILPHD